MKAIARASLLLLLAGCATAPATPPATCPARETLIAAARTAKFFDGGGAVSARGLQVDGSPTGLPDDPWTGVVHYGQWTYGHTTRRMWARVNYDIACFIDCCVAGHCPRVHDYLSGPFELWHATGERLGKGTFVPREMSVDSNCGGARTMGSTISPDSEFWDPSGRRITLEEARAAGWLPKRW